MTYLDDFDSLLNVIRFMRTEVVANAYVAGLLTKDEIRYVSKVNIDDENVNRACKILSMCRPTEIEIEMDSSQNKRARNQEYEFDVSRLRSLRTNQVLDASNMFERVIRSDSKVPLSRCRSLERVVASHIKGELVDYGRYIDLPECRSMVMTAPRSSYRLHRNWIDLDDEDSGDLRYKYDMTRVNAPLIEEFVGNVVEFTTKVPHLRKLHMNQLVDYFHFQRILCLDENRYDDEDALSEVNIEELSMENYDAENFEVMDWITSLPKLRRLYIGKVSTRVSDHFVSYLASGLSQLTHLEMVMNYESNIDINLPNCELLVILPHPGYDPHPNTVVTLNCPKLRRLRNDSLVIVRRL